MVAKKEMLVVPIHEPYAWFILNGHKDIENRSRKIADKWLGQRVAVFVSKTKLTQKAFEEFVEECKELGIKKYPKTRHDFQYGGIVGSVIVTDIVENSKSRWAIKGYKHFLLKSPKKMKFIAMKGQRTPWRVQNVGTD